MRRPSIELAMIVRNGGAGLRRALGSACQVVDRMVIGDTGSTDDSVTTAKSFGAEVLDVPWEDDFAKARNAVLRACRADWVLVLDADEMLDPTGAASVAALTAQTAVEAWEVWKWHYIRTQTSRSGELPARINPLLLEESRPYPAYTQSLSTLLFRRRADVYFEYEVHETVSKRIAALGLSVGQAPFVVHHFGFAEDSEETRRQKLERYHRLGIRKVQAHPQDYWAHYELGLSEFEFRRDPRAALACFMHALRLHPGLHAAWLYAGICLTRLGNFAESMECFARAEEPGRPSALLCEARGDVFFYRREFAQAEQMYRHAGSISDISPLVACKLGSCEVSLGRADQGLARIRAAVEREPFAGELYDIWTAAALMGGDAETAADVAQRRLQIGRPTVDAFVLAAGLQARLHRWDAAVSILREGCGLYLADTRLQHELQIAEERALQAARPA